MPSASPGRTRSTPSVTNRSKAMLRSYLTVGLRALAKNRTYTFINIVGLAVGMAACLMILLFVRYEMSFDKWVPGYQDSYQFQTFFHSKETGEEAQVQMSSFPAA